MMCNGMITSVARLRLVEIVGQVGECGLGKALTVAVALTDGGRQRATG